MNLQNIISEIEKVDPEVYERFDTRRKAMKSFANLSGKLALAAVPLALSSMFNKAYGQIPGNVNSILNFALTLEYLEAEFYNNIVGSPGYLTAPAAAQTALMKIRDDENKHVVFLKSVLGAAAVAKPTFDYYFTETANGIEVKQDFKVLVVHVGFCCRILFLFSFHSCLFLFTRWLRKIRD